MIPIYWHSVLFLIAAGLACGFAVAVVLSNNIVRMAFYLVVSLAAVAALFFLAGADFVGATQIMVYVGGTLVLLVFGVMLTARAPFVKMQTSAGHWVTALAAGACLLAVLLPAALSVPAWREVPPAQAVLARRAVSTATPIGMGLLGVRTDRAALPRESQRQGMSGYLLAFEIISVHLVVVLVGAAYLARARRPRRTVSASPPGNPLEP